MRIFSPPQPWSRIELVDLRVRRLARLPRVRHRRGCACSRRPRSGTFARRRRRAGRTRCRVPVGARRPRRQEERTPEAVGQKAFVREVVRRERLAEDLVATRVCSAGRGQTPSRTPAGSPAPSSRRRCRPAPRRSASTQHARRTERRRRVGSRARRRGAPGRRLLAPRRPRRTVSRCGRERAARVRRRERYVRRVGQPEGGQERLLAAGRLFAERLAVYAYSHRHRASGTAGSLASRPP